MQTEKQPTQHKCFARGEEIKHLQTLGKIKMKQPPNQFNKYLDFNTFISPEFPTLESFDAASCLNLILYLYLRLISSIF